MIPLAPSLLVAAASALVGLEEEGGDNRGQMVELMLRGVHQLPGAPWCAAFVHHVGHAAHFDHKVGRSSWPLRATASCAELGEEARRYGVLKELPDHGPVEGDVFLKYSALQKRFVHTGIVVSVDFVPGPDRPQQWTCTTVEGNTNTDGSANGYAALRRSRRFQSGDAFIRWVNMDRQLRRSA